MNAERLHRIALTLQEELDDGEIVTKLQALVSVCQQMGQQPANTGVQQNFVVLRDNFYGAVTDTPSDSFPPAWRQILTEMGGAELFGANLKRRVQKILADNQATLIVAYQLLEEIRAKLHAFQDALNNLVRAFDYFGIGSEDLAPGEAEIGLLIPRSAVHDKLGDFAEELEEMKFILNTLSEVATGSIDDLKIRTVSSTNLMVYLAASSVLGSMVAKAVDFVVDRYKKILEIRKLQMEIERLELPDEISAKTKEHANTLMEAAIEKFSVEITQNAKVIDDGRRNELTTQVKVSLNKIANRIDKGFNFEVRMEPPEKKAKDEAEDAQTNQALQTIQAASVNMQYMKLEGPPILALPESIESAEAAKTDTEGHQKPRGKRRIHL